MKGDLAPKDELKGDRDNPVERGAAADGATLIGEPWKLKDDDPREAVEREDVGRRVVEPAERFDEPPERVPEPPVLLRVATGRLRAAAARAEPAAAAPCP